MIDRYKTVIVEGKADTAKTLGKANGKLLEKQNSELLLDLDLNSRPEDEVGEDALKCLQAADSALTPPDGRQQVAVGHV